MTRTIVAVLSIVASATRAPGQFQPAPIDDAAQPDVVVVNWPNSETLVRIELTEFATLQEALTPPSPFPTILEAPAFTGPIRSSIFADLDGNALTDWVVLVQRQQPEITTIEHWEIDGDAGQMTFRDVLITGPPPPGRLVACTYGDFDGDQHPDILTIEDLTGQSAPIVRQYERDRGEWALVTSFDLGLSPGAELVAITIGDLDGDAETDAVVVREEAETSSIDHYESSGDQLAFVETLVGAPIITHRFRSVHLGNLNMGNAPDLLVVDSFFYELVDQVQRWEYGDGGLVLEVILDERFAPADSLVGASFAPAQICPGDANGDDEVNVEDLVLVITNWGTCSSSDCPGDVVPDGVVDVQDLIAVITGWGPCD